jgi:hypothetical protein
MAKQQVAKHNQCTDEGGKSRQAEQAHAFGGKGGWHGAMSGK